MANDIKILYTDNHSIFESIKCTLTTVFLC